MYNCEHCGRPMEECPHCKGLYCLCHGCACELVPEDLVSMPPTAGKPVEKPVGDAMDLYYRVRTLETQNTQLRGVLEMVLEAHTPEGWGWKACGCMVCQTGRKALGTGVSQQ